MSDNKFKLAAVQLRTELNWDETMEKAERMIKQAADNGAEVVALPEMFSCPYDKRYFKSFAAMGHEKTVEHMKRWAKENGIILVGGSVPESDGGKLYNTCFVFDEKGEQIARHRKIHLFDVDIPGMRFKESNNFEPGDDITVFDTKFGKMGCAVCFDLRFPELFRAMAMRGAELIIVPAQFNMKTGPSHWEMTLKMRAVDNEVFVVGCSAAKYEGFSYECWGHSAIVSPFGEVLTSCDEKEQIIYSDIDLNRVGEVRRQLPTFLNLRRDVYKVAD